MLGKLPSGCITCGLSSGTQRHRVSYSFQLVLNSATIVERELKAFSNVYEGCRCTVRATSISTTITFVAFVFAPKFLIPEEFGRNYAYLRFAVSNIVKYSADIDYERGSKGRVCGPVDKHLVYSWLPTIQRICLEVLPSLVRA
jgi:hypothetical protein